MAAVMYPFIFLGRLLSMKPQILLGVRWSFPPPGSEQTNSYMSKINVNTPKYWRLPVQNGDDQREVKKVRKVENTPRKPEPADWQKEIDRLFNKFGKENVKDFRKKLLSFEFDPGAEEGDKTGFITYDADGNPRGVYQDFSEDVIEQKKADFEKQIDEYLENNSPCYPGCYDWVRKELEDIKNTKVSEEQKKRFFEILDHIEEVERKNRQKYEKGWHEDITNWDDVVNHNATPVYRTDVELLNKIREMKKHPGVRPIPSITTLWGFEQIAAKICELHQKKNADYGDAAYESYKDFGLVSYVIRLGDKFRRLKTLTSPGYEQQVKTESIEDTLMDLAAYSIMAIEALHKK